MSNYIVYCHTNPANNKRYVGITRQKAEERWQKGKGYRNNILFYRAINKYGWDNFKHEILATNLTETEAKEIEKKLIKEWELTNKEKGYNITDGGDGATGYHHTENTKKLMSNLKTGIKLSPETRAKMSASATGKEKSIETRTKMSEYAKHRTEEHTEKLRRSSIGNRSRKGQKNTPAHTLKSAQARAKKVMCVETGEIYWGVYEAGRELNISGSLISKVLRKERKHTHGYTFVYVEG